MMLKILYKLLPNAIGQILLPLMMVFLMAGCGGGGGGDSDPVDPPITKENVIINGIVDVGTAASPVKNAHCRFVDGEGVEQATATSDADGQFSIEVPPDTDGYLTCSPSNLSNLALSTYSTTRGFTNGDTIENENVTPSTTVVVQIIESEDVTDPSIRKEELLESIASAQDPYLNLVVELSTRLYVSMLKHNMDVSFGDSHSGEGGDSGDGGGAGGEAGDGGDFSPLPEATCEFIVDNNLGDSKGILYQAALADFYADGQINRPDLVAIQNEINSAYEGREQEIIAAFESLFPTSPGRSYSTTTDENGNYFLSIPPNVAGFVRCTPKDQERLVLATYVPPRSKGESMPGQDVNPATTVFSKQIASKLNTSDQQKTKENYLNDIDGLDVQILHEDDAVSGFQLRPGTAPANKEVGLVAFSATSLYNILYKNKRNVDYLAALDDFNQKQRVDPDFLADQGVPTEEAQSYSGVVDNAVEETETNLEADLDTALSTARINLTVTDTTGGAPQSGVIIDIAEDLPDEVTCQGCGTATDADGQATLVLSGLTDETTDLTLIATDQTGDEASLAVQVVALATMNPDLAMNPSFSLTINNDGDGTGAITSDTGDINCTFNEDTTADCGAELIDDTTITLTAVADDGSDFTGWQGACSGTEPSCTVTMDQARTVSASFSLQCITANFSIYPPNATFTAIGGMNVISIQKPSECEVNAATEADWITITEQGVGAIESHAFLNYTVDQNTDSGPRTATLTVAGIPHTIIQDGEVCANGAYIISPMSASFPATGGTGTIDVDAPEGCPWQATTNDDWIILSTETDAEENTGAGTISFSVNENTGTSARNGTISIAGQSYTVTQEDPSTPQALTLTLQNGGDNGSGTVTDDLGDINCTITADGASGDCTVTYDVETPIQLDAVPTDGSIFAGWTNGCSGTEETCILTLDQSLSVGVQFRIITQANLGSDYLWYNGDSNTIPVGSAIGDLLSLSITNSGIEDAGTFSVGLYLSADEVIDVSDTLLDNGRVEIEGLAAGASVDVSFSPEAVIPADMEPGQAYLGVVIDESDTVSEDVETNNTISLSVTIVDSSEEPTEE